MIHIETLLLREELCDTDELVDWRDPTRMVPLDEATIPPGCATAVLPGVVLLDMGGVAVFDHTYDTDVWGWWPRFVGALELAAAPQAASEFGFPDQPLAMRMRRHGDRVTCSLDYDNSRTRQRVKVSATDSFDELLRKSLDRAEEFYARIIELDPENAGMNLGILNVEVLDVRRRLRVQPWPGTEAAA